MNLVSIAVLFLGIIIIILLFILDFNKIYKIIGTILGILLILSSFCIYTQDVGEVVVLRNLGGELAGYTEAAGFHTKMPWQNTIEYDVRNNIINLYRNDEYSYDNGKASGSEVTVYDKSGAQANVDVQVIYSLDADAAIELYTKYQEQSNFVQIVAVNNVRDATRNVSGQFSTIQMLTSREDYAKAIYDKLVKDWDKLGLHVEEVNVQDIRYSQEIIGAYNSAQKTEISKVEAQNQQETEKIKMDTEVMKAQKEAEANEIRSKSLTPEILEQQYIDALKNGQNVYVVPENSMPVINLQQETKE